MSCIGRVTPCILAPMSSLRLAQVGRTPPGGEADSGCRRGESPRRQWHPQCTSSHLTPLSGMPLFQQSHSECAREVANDDRNYVQHAHLKLFPPATRLFARASGQKSMAACKRRHVHAPTCKETSARDSPRPETTVSPYFLADGREDPRAAPPEWLARAGTTSHRHWGNAWSL